MSWFDKVGDAFSWAKDTAVPAIGAAIASAGSGAANYAWEGVKPGVEHVVAPAMQALSWAGTEVGRGVATGAIMTDRASSMPDHSGVSGLRFLVDGDAWHSAWNDSENISPFQAIQTGFRATPGDVSPSLDMTPDQIAKRKDFFENSWAGKLSSGAGDLVLDIYTDPLVIAGKAVKAQRLAKTAIGAGDAGAALKVAAGEVDEAPKGIAEAGDKVGGFIDWTRGKTPSENYQHPVLKKNPEGGTLAALFSAADQTAFDDAAEHLGEGASHADILAEAQPIADAAKRKLLGATLGDNASIQALKEDHAALADRLYNLSTTPDQSKWVDTFSWNDHGQGALFALNKRPELIETAAEKTAIAKEMARLNRIIEAQGTSSRISATGTELSSANAAVSGLRTSVLYDGPGARPVAIVAGQLRNRLDGHVSLRDPVAGYTQLESTLKQSRFVNGAERRALLDRFLNAASDGDRREAVMMAEEVTLKKVATHYGIDPKDVAAFLVAANGRRSSAVNFIKDRLYTAAKDDPIIKYLDPEGGIEVVNNKPILQSQIEDFHPFVDPRHMEQVVRQGKRVRLFEGLADKIGGATGKDLATLGYSVAGKGWDYTSSALMWATRMWKDLTLLPRTIAYAMRTQADSQTRITAHTSLLNWLSGIPEVARSLAVAYRKNAINPFAEASVHEALTPWAAQVGMEPDELKRILDGATTGNPADIASELSNGAYQRMVSRGGYTRIHPDNEQWMPAYQRAVLQIQHSPTAMKAVSGLSPEDLRKFVFRSPEGQQEWLNMRHSFDGDVDAWLHNVQSHVDHLLPMPEQRIDLMSAPQGEILDQATIENWFKDTGLEKMPTHGESLSPLQVNPVAEMYSKSRERLYHLVAEVPETVAAKAPLYVAVYKRNLRDILTRLDDGGAERMSINSPEMTNARKQADRMARREIGEVLFNASHTSNLAHTMRFVAPFWAAWEDMMRKWGKLLYDNPEFAERLHQAWMAPEAVGLGQDDLGNRVDAHGNHWHTVTDPVTGEQTEVKLDPVKNAALIGQRSGFAIPLGWIPKNLRSDVGLGDKLFIDKSSLNLLFQGNPPLLPGLGPLVQVPANEIIKRAFSDSTDNPVISYLLPYGTSKDSVLEQSVPAWARRIIDSGATPFGKNDEWRQQASIMLREKYIAWEQGGRQGPAPTIDDIAGNVRNWFLMRTFVNLTSPVSVTPSQELQFYIDKGREYKQEYGGIQDTPEYHQLLLEYQGKYDKTAKDHLLNDHPEFTGWEARFQRDFPQYFDMAMSVSTNGSGLVATAKVETLRHKYAKVIRANDGKYGDVIAGPDNAYGLTPDTKFSSIADDAQLMTETSEGSGRTLRSYQDPTTALATAEASKGWTTYQTSRTKLNLWLEDNGYASLRQAPESMRAAWKTYVQQLGEANNYWRDDFNNRQGSGATDMLIAMKKAMADNPSLANQQHMQALGGYMQARAWARQQLASRTGTIDAKANADIAQVFDGYVMKLRQWSPGFEQIYNRYLDNDPLDADVK